MLSTLNDTRLDFIWCNKDNFLSITQNWRKLDKRDKSAVNFCFNCRKRKTWNTTGILSMSISVFFVTDFHILEIIASISAKILFFFYIFSTGFQKLETIMSISAWMAAKKDTNQTKNPKHNTTKIHILYFWGIICSVFLALKKI